MKCHYEVLGVSRMASNDEIRKAYRKLTLKWNLDKNINNPEEAKKQSELAQQAWDVLSDPDERAWYDKHRQAILKGGDYKDGGINLFRYFSTDCYKGYKDDENGFYAVYRSVFEKIAAEDAEFAEEGDSDEEIPSFGDSESSFDDVVYNFYTYWESYNTKKSFTWLNPHDLRYMPNRNVAKLAEKENKRIRDKAKRETNERIRSLVAFVGKRDKRVDAYVKLLAERAEENAKKTQLHKFGEQLSSNTDADSDDNVNALYCPECNKSFKTHEAFRNHEKSTTNLDSDEDEKSDSEEYTSDEDSEVETIQRRPQKKLSKNKEAARNSNMTDRSYSMLEQLRIDMYYVSTSDEELMSDLEEKNENESVVVSKKPKKKSKRRNGRGSTKDSVSEDEDDVNIDDIDWLSKKQRKKQQQKVMLVAGDEEEKESVKERRQRRQMERQIRDGDRTYDFSKIEDIDIQCWGHFCSLCSAEFTTKNRLFEHLKKTGHSMYVPDKAKHKRNNSEQTSKPKGNFYRRNN